jgi:hypothetical protein
VRLIERWASHLTNPVPSFAADPDGEGRWRPFAATTMETTDFPRPAEAHWTASDGV